MRKRLVQAIVVWLLTIALTVSAFTILITDPAPVPEDEAEETVETIQTIQSSLAEKQNVRATILGDSIAKGYSRSKDLEIVPYGTLVMEELAEEDHFSYAVENYGKNGLDCEGMNEDILTDETVRASISSADVLFITVGSNDLLNTFKSSVREILETETRFRSVDEAAKALTESVAENPMLILKVIDAIENWDYPAFEEEWIKMMETVDGLKKEDAWIVVTNIYNPVSNLELPSTMNRVVEEIIRNMNQIMEDHAEEFGYHVADVYHTDVCVHVQKDGVHPDQEGQQIIADRIWIHK